MSKFLTFFAVLFFVISVLAYTNAQTRCAGIAEDIKYVERYGEGYLFIVYTEEDRIYKILCDGVPYFNIGDTLTEYWFDYTLKGIGKKNSIYYYNIAK